MSFRDEFIDKVCVPTVEKEKREVLKKTEETIKEYFKELEKEIQAKKPSNYIDFSNNMFNIASLRFNRNAISFVRNNDRIEVWSSKVPETVTYPIIAEQEQQDTFFVKDNACVNAEGENLDEVIIERYLEKVFKECIQ